VPPVRRKPSTRPAAIQKTMAFNTILNKPKVRKVKGKKKKPKIYITTYERRRKRLGQRGPTMVSAKR
jgi:hypothetical protein